jgi:hypothetical protein
MERLAAKPGCNGARPVIRRRSTGSGHSPSPRRGVGGVAEGARWAARAHVRTAQRVGACCARGERVGGRLRLVARGHGGASCGACQRVRARGTGGGRRGAARARLVDGALRADGALGGGCFAGARRADVRPRGGHGTGVAGRAGDAGSARRVGGEARGAGGARDGGAHGHEPLRAAHGRLRGDGARVACGAHLARGRCRGVRVVAARARGAGCGAPRGEGARPARHRGAGGVGCVVARGRDRARCRPRAS